MNHAEPHFRIQGHPWHCSGRIVMRAGRSFDINLWSQLLVCDASHGLAECCMTEEAIRPSLSGQDA